MTAPDTEAGTPREAPSAGEARMLLADRQAAGTRLDQWLTSQLGGAFSRSRVQSMIESGEVTVNGRREVSRYRLAQGDRILWHEPEPESAQPAGEAIPLDVLYEDGDLIVINKQPGLVVHPGAGNPSGTLVNALIHHCGTTLSGIGGVRRPGIVHRLDKDTSGIMVIAKNDRTHKALAEAFADHGRTGDLKRSYTAIVWGTPPRQTGLIDAPLGRAPGSRIKRAVVSADRPDARHAVTRYRVTELFGKNTDGAATASMVECTLETGRTHQIRVHMVHIGNPLIGDATYGKSHFSKTVTLPGDIVEVVRDFPRQALHAHLLCFRHPVKDELMRFEVPPPGDMRLLIAALRHL